MEGYPTLVHPWYTPEVCTGIPSPVCMPPFVGGLPPGQPVYPAVLSVLAGRYAPVMTVLSGGLYLRGSLLRKVLKEAILEVLVRNVLLHRAIIMGLSLFDSY